ncbi:NAD-dependent epimerase/dehydratase family protein [Streptomyces sp. NPDC015237]|uniref:NAD-dependent epimerase/dehydratase family protein n=1 Tax=Streptomyces sp. NPDC015237 TaxID=3364949 RepID=UPI0036F5EC05
MNTSDGWRPRRVPEARGRAGAPRTPVDYAKIGRSSVRRRARGMTHSEAVAALEGAEQQAHLDRRDESAADDGGRRAANVMRIVVIGGSGHIGTFLVPRLVQAGHEVINISRGTSTAYATDPAWQQVRQVVADRQQQDREGTFGDTVTALNPDVVVDLVCFTLESATALVESLRGEVGHLLHCGSLWRYGPAVKCSLRWLTCGLVV